MTKQKSIEITAEQLADICFQMFMAGQQSIQMQELMISQKRKGIKELKKRYKNARPLWPN